MKKILQRVSTIVMVCLLIAMTSLFSGCLLKYAPRTRSRFFEANAVWVCDDEDFKIALETKGGEVQLYSKLTLNGETMDVYVHVGTLGSRGAVWVCKLDEMESVDNFRLKELEGKCMLFKVNAKEHYFREADKMVTW